MVSLSANDDNQLRRWEAAQGTPQQVALRCRLILAAAAGKQDLEIAATYGVNRHTAALWRQRVRSEGVAAVWEIQPGRGRKPVLSQAKHDAVVAATLKTKPKGYLFSGYCPGPIPGLRVLADGAIVRGNQWRAGVAGGRFVGC
jgi:hypothetical protein